MQTEGPARLFSVAGPLAFTLAALLAGIQMMESRPARAHDALYNADALAQSAYHRDAVLGQKPPSGWVLPTFYGFYPELGIYSLVHFLSGDAYASIWINGWLQWLLLQLLWILLLRRMLKASAVWYGGSLSLLLFAFLLRGGTTELPLAAAQMSYHAGTAIAFLLHVLGLMVLVSGPQTSGRRAILCLWLVNGIAATVSDPLFLFFAIPASFAGLGWLKLRSPPSAAVLLRGTVSLRIVSGLLGVIALVGLLGLHWLSGKPGFRLMARGADRPVQAFTSALFGGTLNSQHVRDSAVNLLEAAGSQGLVLFFGCALFATASVLLVRMHGQEGTPDERLGEAALLSLLVLAPTACLVVSAVVYGGAAIPRYGIPLWSGLAVLPGAMLASWVRTSKAPRCEGQRRGLNEGFLTLRPALRLALLLSAVCSIGLGVWLFQTRQRWLKPPPRDRTVPLVTCLDRLSERVPLVWGIGGYWDARPVTLLSERGLRVNPVEGRLELNLWINNYYDFLGERETPPYNFVIARGILPEGLQRLGKPDAEFQCPGTLVLYYRDRAALRNLYSRARILLWLRALGFEPDGL